MTDTLETPTPKKRQKRSAHKRPKFEVGDHNDEWGSNAELIADVMDLYLKPGMALADVTYGLGKFWNLGIPDRCEFIAHDINPAKGDGVSFLDLPDDDGSLDIVVFDPEYVSRGGRATSTLDKGLPDGQVGMIDRYGMDAAPKTPEALWTEIRTGMEEIHRTLKVGGLIMVKCQNYISSATLQPYVKWALDAFDEIGYDLEDWAILTGHPGPQPLVNPNGTERIQAHLRQNASHLLIGKKRR